MSEMDPDQMMGRQQVAKALTARGYPVAAATLATKATRGGGPPYRLFCARAVYRWQDALQWAQRSVRRPVHKRDA